MFGFAKLQLFGKLAKFIFILMVMMGDVMKTFMEVVIDILVVMVGDLMVIIEIMIEGEAGWPRPRCVWGFSLWRWAFMVHRGRSR